MSEKIIVYPSVTNVKIKVTKSKAVGVKVGFNLGLQLGTTEDTAFRGDQGLIAYEHAQITNANPHGTRYNQLLARSVPIGDLDTTGTPDATTFLRGDGQWTTVTAVEVNDLTAAVVWANVPDVNITQSSVTQHQASLTITESQISDFGSYLTSVDLGYTAATRTITNTGGTNAVLPLFTSTEAGLVPLSGGGTINFLRADGTWAAPPSGGANQLSDLSDVNTPTPTNRNILIANGVNWESRALVEADISDLGNYAVVGHAHAASDITSGTFSDSRISQSSVTQHQASLTITESQISDLGSYAENLAQLSDVVSATNTSGFVLVANGTTGYVGRALVEADISDLGNYAVVGHTHATSDITSGTFADARIAQSNVTQHETAITITESQISNLQPYLLDITGENLSSLTDVTITSIATGEILKWDGLRWVNNTLAEAGIAAVGHTHAAADVTTGTFADARIAQSAVTQHQAALSITESQISDLTKPTLKHPFTIPQPADHTADNPVFFYTPVAITITSVASAIKGTTNVVFNIQHSSTADGTFNNVFTSDITLTSTSGQINNSGFNDATIPAGSWVRVNIVSVSGTPDWIHGTIIYTED